MKNVTQRPFSILADCGKIYQFLLETYERDWRNGVPAPFFEYAYASFSYWNAPEGRARVAKEENYNES